MEIKSKRLPNFEILRVLCMFMVVVIHCTWHGASPLFNKADIPQPYYNLIGINLIYPVINIAVDVFVLISGYFMSVQSTDAGCWRKVFSKSLRLWLQIAFYSVFFYVGYTLLRGTTFSVKDLVHYVLPVRFGQYWFMTSYMMLLVISPFLTKIVSVLSRKEYIYLIILTAGGVILQLSQFKDGFSVLWFIYLFFVAGYIRKYDALLNWQNKSGRYFFDGIWFVGRYMCHTESDK